MLHCLNNAIVMADNSVHPVQSKGSMMVRVNDSTTRNFTLNDVYHVPGMAKNLVSVSQVPDSGKHVLFGPQGVLVLENLRSMMPILLQKEKK